MSAAKLIHAFARVAPRYLRFFPPSTCIEQTRVFIEVMAIHGVHAEAISTKLILQCPKKQIMFLSGFSEAEQDGLERRAVEAGSSWTRRKERIPGDDAGHVVAFAEGHLIDLTLSQASMPEQGFILERDIVILPIPDDALETFQLRAAMIEGKFQTDGGLAITVDWELTPRQSFRDTPAWEPSHLWAIIGIIANAVTGEINRCRT